MENNVYIQEMGKKIPIIYTKQVKDVKIFIQWDEFYIKANPKHNVDKVHRIIRTKNDWMMNRLSYYEDDVKELKRFIAEKDLKIVHKRTKQELKDFIWKCIKKYSYKGVPSKIMIKSGMNLSWATHSCNHNLSFSDNLLYLPDELIEYNVYHELCHFEEWSHNNHFFELMAEVYPNYKDFDKLLNAYSYILLHENLWL